MKPLDAMVGQPRALQALMFGFQMKEPGFNIFAAGPPGTGKTTTVTDFLEDIARKLPTPSDWCYIHNFTDEYQPNILRLPPGTGKQLRQDMKEFVQAARLAIPRLFEGEDYARKRDEIIRKMNQKRQDTINRMGQLAQEEGFTMQLTALGISLVPVIKGKPITDEDFVSLPEDTRQKLLQKRGSLQEKLSPLLRELLELEAKTRDDIAEFDRDVALYAIEHLMSSLLEKYKAHDEITNFLREIQNHIVDDLEGFRRIRGNKKEASPEAVLAEEMAFRVYDVNVVVDNSGNKGAPIVIEQNPTYDNVLGRVEKESQLGTLTTDFTLIPEDPYIEQMVDF